MKCSNCQFENPEGAKFCQNCGEPQTVACHSCGTRLPRGAKFCFNCGAPQTSAGPAHVEQDRKRAEVEDLLLATRPAVIWKIEEGVISSQMGDLNSVN